MVLGMFELQCHGADTYVGEGPEYPWGGLYGGQIVAQALRAAAATVPNELSPHSLRAYFIRRGDLHQGEAMITIRSAMRSIASATGAASQPGASSPARRWAPS